MHRKNNFNCSEATTACYLYVATATYTTYVHTYCTYIPLPMIPMHVNQGNTYLNNMLRIGLRRDTDTDTDTSYKYESDPLPQSLIGSECIGMKGEISHPTLNRIW